MIIEDLNYIEFSESDLNRYEELGHMSQEKSEELSNHVKNTLAKANMEEIHNNITSLLEENEKINETVKCIDVDKIALVTAIGKYIVSPCFDFALNNMVFITGKRIFIVDTNYCNKQFKINEYKKSDLHIKQNKIFHKNMSSMYRIIFAVSCVSGINLVLYLSKFNIALNILLYAIYVTAAYLLLKLLSNKSNSLMVQSKNGDIFELYPTNITVKELKNLLKNSN